MLKFFHLKKLIQDSHSGAVIMQCILILKPHGKILGLYPEASLYMLGIHVPMILARGGWG